MNNIQKILLFLFFITTLITICSAQLLDLKINKNYFTLNEEVKIDVTVSNNYDKTIYLDVLVSCLNNSGDFIPFTRSFEIKDRGIRTLSVYNAKITDLFPSGEYLVEIFLKLDKDSVSYDSKKDLKFVVKGTKSNFGIRIKTCRDTNCLEESKLFKLNEEIYLDYESKINGVVVEGNLVYPSGEKKEIILPYSFSADKIGTYQFSGGSFKEGYLNQSSKIVFGVIKENAEIRDASKCEADGICIKGENYKNCPQDCVYYNKNNFNYLIISLLLLLFVVILFYIIRKKNKK